MKDEGGRRYSTEITQNSSPSTDDDLYNLDESFRISASEKLAMNPNLDPLPSAEFVVGRKVLFSTSCNFH